MYPRVVDRLRIPRGNSQILLDLFMGGVLVYHVDAYVFDSLVLVDCLIGEIAAWEVG